MRDDDPPGGEDRGGPPARTILVVEDSKVDRALYRKHLAVHADHWRIHEAVTGAEGLESVDELRPDCVLLDYYLPDMEGAAFLKKLRERAGSDVPEVPVAILTGSDDWRLAERALREGAEDYVVKGTLTSLGLVRVVENAIEKHAVRQQNERQRAALEMRTWQLELVRSELQEKVAELSAATKARDQFMAVMSHEMRTPLNAILGYAELLEMGVHGPLREDQAELVQRVQVGGRHLLELINDVLDLARADAQEIELEIEPVDLVAVAEEVGQLLERKAAEKGLRLEVRSDDAGVHMARADLRRIRQILTNLIGNAIKFTHDGGITIDFGRRGGLVAVEVTDTGMGIDPEVLPLVFDRFFQADGSYTREEGGSGLGLAIAQRLAHLMGGDIQAESRLGEGSRFTLLVPVHRPGDVEAPEQVVAEAPVEEMAALRDPGSAPTDGAAGGRDAAEGPVADAPSDGDRPPVTVVAFSDDREGLSALEEHVSPSVRVVWTSDPDEVRRLAAEVQPSLVVLDVSAERGAGWTAAHSLQDVAELAATAVLLLPEIPRPQGGTSVPGLDLGWVSLVPKPFTEEQLTSAVSRAAGGRDEAAEPDERPDGPLDVLVVDDDPDSRHVARSFLQGANLAVREAEDGPSGLLAMRYRKPDVVVLDLMMPVLDGFGVLAAMRADPALAGTPVVVLSAKSLSEAERRFLARSATRVLQKGQHRLADVAALVTKAARGSERSGEGLAAPPPGP